MASLTSNCQNALHSTIKLAINKQIILEPPVADLNNCNKYKGNNQLSVDEHTSDIPKQLNNNYNN